MGRFFNCFINSRVLTQRLIEIRLRIMGFTFTPYRRSTKENFSITYPWTKKPSNHLKYHRHFVSVMPGETTSQQLSI